MNKVLSLLSVFLITALVSACDHNGGSDPDMDLDLNNPTIKNLIVEIDDEDLVFLKEAGLELNIAIKVNNTFNVVWYSDSDYLEINKYQWSPTFELYGSNDFQAGSTVEMQTNTVSTELGQEATLDSAGDLGPAMDGGPTDSISFINNFGPIHPGLAQQLIEPSGTVAILPTYVTPDPIIAGTEVLTPVNEVILWFEENTTGTQFSELPSVSFMVELTGLDEITVLYTDGEWSISDM